MYVCVYMRQIKINNNVLHKNNYLLYKHTLALGIVERYKFYRRGKLHISYIYRLYYIIIFILLLHVCISRLIINLLHIIIVQFDCYIFIYLFLFVTCTIYGAVLFAGRKCHTASCIAKRWFSLDTRLASVRSSLSK
jgi:hypothetical protein